MKMRSLLIGGAAILAASAVAFAAGYFPGFPIVGGSSYCTSFVMNPLTGAATTTCNGPAVPAGPAFLTGNELIPADTQLAQGQAPQTVLISTSLLTNQGFPRNLLDNGSMNVQQRGTGIITCAANAAITSAAYGPDRWGCSANVGSGAGRQQVATTAALLPTGFINVNKLYRTSGALTQPVCAWQEVPGVESTSAAGKTVTLSFYAAALAGLNADTANVITATIISGTGSDEGFGTMTASPAITPAWTGLAAALNQSPITITTTPTRYQVSAAIPATATEIAVALCFTPTATGAGVTDGFAFTGAQLEISPSAGPYEFHVISYDLARAQRYFYRITESATTIFQRALCAVSSSSLGVCQINFPQVMRTAPTMTYTSGFEMTVGAQTSAVVCTVTRTSTTLTGAAASTTGVPIDCTSSAGFGAAGTAAQLYDIGTGSATGVISASADF